MKNALRSALAVAIVAVCSTELVADDASGSWIKVIPAGTFSGRDGRGPWHAGDRAQLEAILQTSLAIAGSTDLVVDYDHQSVFSAVPMVGGKAPAAGWMKELEARDDGLWARIEWTPAAQQKIKDREYRYLSPIFLHDKSGKVLCVRMAGLTNTPNLDLPEVAANSLIFTTTIQEEPMEKILKALGLAEGTSVDAVIAAINAMQTSSTNMALAAGLTKDAVSDEIVAAINSMSADLKKVRSAAKLQDGATGDDIVTAINTVQAGSYDPAKFVPVAQVQQLQKDVTELRTKLTTGEAETAVNKAVEEGRLAPALRGWGLELYAANAQQFNDYVKSAPVLTATQLSNTTTTPSNGGLSDVDMAVCSQMGLTPEQFLKSRKQGES